MMLRSRWMHWMAVATVLALLAGGVAIPLQAQEQRTVAFGPYVQNVGTNNATICWTTVAAEVTVTPPVTGADTIRDYQTHSVLLRNLLPGTTYTYQVPGYDGDASRCTFTTVPEGERSFAFAIISDTQNRGNPAHRPLIERISADRPDLLFNVGDLVSDGRNILDWEEFFEVNHDLMRSVPYYPALGNHERDAALYFDFFVLPGNERYYSFNRGAAHFVVLDTPGIYPPEDNQALTPAGRDRFLGRREQYFQQQLQWLAEDLAGHQEAKYVFVFFHYPLYSVLASRVEGANQLRTRFGTVFQDHNVTAVFHGHDHHYHRAVAGGVQFVSGGAAGGRARPVDAPPHPETVKSASVESYMWVDVGAERAQVRVTDVAGNTVDEFDLAPRRSSSQ